MSYLSDKMANLEQRQRDRRERAETNTLPKYAFPYSHPAAGKGDVGAEFRADDGMTICVSIERCDEGMATLDIHRGGIGENLFTRGELAKVIELAGILLAANGKQPEREK